MKKLLLLLTLVFSQFSVAEIARHDFPYESRYADIKGSQLHYIDTAPSNKSGSTIVFLHGQPTWSYLWRNIIPAVEKTHRVVAPDLVGFGKSDKPYIDYSIETHAEYFDALMTKLQLEDVILVIHDWGSFIGLDWAAKNPGKVKGVAFMESILPSDGSFDRESQQMKILENFEQILKNLRTPGLGEKMILQDNFFLERILLSGETLTEDQKQAYREPFANDANRYPMLMFPRQVPLGNFDGYVPTYVLDSMTTYAKWMSSTEIPMLQLIFTPGAINGEHTHRWVKQNVSNLTVEKLPGAGIHFVQETHHKEISMALQNWLKSTGL